VDPQDHRRYEFGTYVLDEKERLLWHFESPVSLPPKAFDTLLLLVKNGGHIVEKEEMFKTLWPDAIVEENNLTHYISLLRRELGDRPNDQQYIETVPKHGYRFVAEVRVTFGDSHPGHSGLTSSSVLTPHISETSVPFWRRLPTSAMWGALLLVLSGPVAYLWFSRSSPRAAATPPAIRTLAVLPFKTLDPDSTEEYLSLGVADVVIRKLSGLKSIAVRQLTSVEKYSTPGMNPSTVGRELQVDAVLDGSVHRISNTLRVTAQLVSVNGDKVLWSEKFETPISDIQGLDELISTKVTTALSLKVDDKEKSHLAKRYTENAEAYEAYLKGLFFMEKRTEEGFKKGFEYFQRAVELDPMYAPAYVGEAHYYGVASDWLLPREEALRKADLALSKALELDDSLAEGHALMSHTRLIAWDWEGAEREIMRALELSPQSSEVHLYNSYYLATIGRLEEAYAEMKLVKQLDPVSAANHARLAALSADLGRYDEALELCRKAVEIEPSSPVCHDVVGFVNLKIGKRADGVSELQKSVQMASTEFYPYGELGYAYAELGRRKEALEIVDKLMARKGPATMRCFAIAMIYAGLRENDLAFKWLNDSYNNHEVMMMMVRFDPYLEPLRSDPRFAQLLRRMRFPQA
jgi:DNA-binding winged helix-turn-helix (wHTH) protein/TolB-like protein/Flp pilus assembly protein TadD